MNANDVINIQNVVDILSKIDKICLNTPNCNECVVNKSITNKNGEYTSCLCGLHVDIIDDYIKDLRLLIDNAGGLKNVL